MEKMLSRRLPEVKKQAQQAKATALEQLREKVLDWAAQKSSSLYMPAIWLLNRGR
jgi:F0F1-type ATP synthase membrane subunit b/b'